MQEQKNGQREGDGGVGFEVWGLCGLSAEVRVAQLAGFMMTVFLLLGPL
jgi:hypothetical protein